MAKSKGSSNRTNYRSGRDVTITPIARRSLPLNSVAQIEDQRHWIPNKPVAPARAIKRSDTRLVAKKYKPIYAVNFQNPRNVSICAKRSVRQQVMFAKKIAGKSGVGRNKKRRTNQWSNYSCR